MRTRAALVAVAATLLALVVVLVPPLGSGSALATHPCGSPAPGATPSESPSPSPSPSGNPAPPDRYSHPACAGDPPAPTAADVVVTANDNGKTVHVTVGQRLGVQLTAPYDSAVTWSDISAGGALYRTRLYVGGYATDAVFRALSASPGETVTATTDALCRHQDTPCPTAMSTWSVTVVVDEPSPGPSPSSSSEPCYAYPPSSPQPGAVVVQESDRGRTISVRQGDSIRVYLGGSCPAGGGYQPAVATGPLYREGVDAYQPGAMFAAFRAVGTGSTTITATTDAPCLHTSPGCAIPQQLWSVTVEIAPAGCTLTGPADRPSGSEVALRGTGAPGATAQVWFRQRGTTDFVVRRTVTVRPDGTYLVLYAGNDDYRYYATVGDCTTPAGLTHVTSWATGPRYAARGSVVPVTVHGPAGAVVALYLRRAGGEFHLARTGHLDGAGVWRTSYVALVDQRYYAVTGPDGRRTAGVLTQVR